MPFLEQVGRKISEAGQDVAHKAKNLAETARLDNLIAEEQKNLNNTFLLIGRTYFDRFADNPDPMFAQAIASVNQSNQQIEQWREQLKQLKGIMKCSRCNADVPYGSQFCPSCGAVLTETAPDGPVEIAQGRLCRNCGSFVAAELETCPFCGAHTAK